MPKEKRKYGSQATNPAKVKKSKLPGYKKRPMSKALSKSYISKKKRRAFLDILAKTGRVTEAALAVGYSSTDYLHTLRRQDEEFAEAWDQALEAAGDMIENEAVRRAVDGVLEPQYYQGEVVGYVPKYSDSLMALLLKKFKPEYKDKSGSDVNVNFGVAFMPTQSKNEDAWEAKAIEVHADQKLITIEDKPKENLMIEAKAHLKRGN